MDTFRCQYTSVPSMRISVTQVATAAVPHSNFSSLRSRRITFVLGMLGCQPCKLRSAAVQRPVATCRALRRPAFVTKMSTVPKLLAFDLDGTLWWPEMYMLNGGAPFRRNAKGAVFDCTGEQLRLMGASEQILREICTDPKWRDTKVAYVSRTEYPEWAIPALKAFEIIPGVTMYDMAHHREIYPGNKLKHFRVIHQQSKIPYEEMLFFDNERRNCVDCSSVGIHCVYTPDGMMANAWQEGLAKYAAAAKQTVR